MNFIYLRLMTKSHLSSSPFGSIMPTRVWSDASKEYRYGFNGKEKDFETANDNYDFGARIYDGRLGRFLTLDPLISGFSSLSSYIYCYNSPISFIDIKGEKPKIAIIMVDESNPYEFDDHIKALKAKGYKIIRVYNGQQLIEALKNNSSKSSPIKNLTIISHGFSKGLIGGQGYNTGIYTDEFIHDEVDRQFKEKQKNLYFNGIVTDPLDPNFDQNAYDNALNNYNNYINSPQYQSDLDAEITQYKIDKKCATISDLNNAIQDGSIHLDVNLAPIVLGGCNTAGYNSYNSTDGTVTTDKESFASKLADNLNKTVVGSTGDTAPIHKSSKRSSDGAWLRHNADGEAKIEKLGKLDLTNVK